MIVTLTTDFGFADSYVAQMKGVILSIAPEVRIVDVTHEVNPQDVRSAAFVLAQVVPVFPRGTIHVAVIDPGVGGARAAVIVETEDYVLVGPDNGLLSLAAPVFRAAYRIQSPEFRRAGLSPTFEGRDVFAPAAARLCAGARACDAGPEIGQLQSLDWHEPTGDVGEVIYIDRFGNLITNLRAEHVADAQSVAAGTLDAPLVRTYSDANPGAPLAYIGSSGYVEIGMRDASAAQWTAAKLGMPVKVKR
jgi:S-adenosylmethionine hydrolase